MHIGPLAQLTVPPVQDVTSADGGLQSTVITIVSIVIFLIVALLILRSLLGRRKKLPPPAEKALPGTAATTPVAQLPPKVVLPPSELEAKRLAEVESARAQADEARRRRESIAQEAKSADEAQRAKLD